jgi:hypothetical protein
MAAQDDSRTPCLQGFKGWLLVLAAFQCLLLLRESIMLAHIGTDYVRGTPTAEVAPFSILYLGRILIYGAFIVVLAYAMVLMAWRRRQFLRVFRMEMKLFILLPIVDFLWVAIAPWPGRVSLFSPAVILLIAVHLALGLGWLRYEEKSKRMHNTFLL